MTVRLPREELAETDLVNLAHTRELIARWVEHYNQERLHAGLHYLTPATYHSGDPKARLQERSIKLEQARARRAEYHRALSSAA